MCIRDRFMVAKAPNEEYKNDTLRGFGTTRLVASDRMKHITPQQMRSLETLRSIAQERKAGGAKQGTKTDFNKSSLKKFQDSVMMADPAILARGNPKPEAKNVGSGLNLFKKMRDFDPANHKKKFGQ
eukprot:TRINITY_DN893_c0_g2_i2.p1 TRINITY_DN893_c0_g2~~TRINITY_DN893_c0_g2_i2.p1  ORF type:complete len:127 (+),score=38.04 TRINITY_DN893_c0_g2_i2:73-453(+)